MKLDSVPLEEIVLQKVRFGFTQHQNIFPQDLKYEAFEDFRVGRMIHHLSWSLLGKKVGTTKYPETWVEAIKDKFWRFIPNPLKRRFPIKYKTLDHWHVCPHINHVFSKDQRIHFSFLDNSLFKEKGENEVS